MPQLQGWVEVGLPLRRHVGPQGAQCQRGKLTAWSHALRATSEFVSLTFLHIKKQSMSSWPVQNNILWMDSKVDALILASTTVEQADGDVVGESLTLSFLMV